MCLIASHKDPKIANEDLIVYKLMDIRNRELYSPYQNHKWTIGKCYKHDGLPETDSKYERDKNGLRKEVWEINEGIFHSYPSLEETLDRADRILTYCKIVNNFNKRFTVVKCCIPKGSYIWKGEESTCPRHPNIGSIQLIALEIVTIVKSKF